VLQAKVLVHTELSPNPAKPGEPVVLSIQRIVDLNQNQQLIQAPTPQLPEIQGLKLLATQTGQNISSLDQSMRMIQTYGFTLVADKAGEYRIPELALGDENGKAIQTQAINLIVKAPEKPFTWTWILLPIFLILGGGMIFLKQKKHTKSQQPRPHSISIAQNAHRSSISQTDEPLSLENIRNSFKQTLLDYDPNLHSGMTTQEICNFLAESPKCPPQLPNEIEAFLESLDAYRFQAIKPSMEVLKNLEMSANKLIKQLKS